MNLTRQQARIIGALAKYGYLTNSQLALLGISSRNRIRRITHYLSRTPDKSPLLRVHKFPVHARFGRLENVYHLSESGESLATQLTNQLCHVSSSVYALDFFHRKDVITFRILLDLALKRSRFRIDQYENYFEFTGANHRKQGTTLSARTKALFDDGSFLIPDSIFVIADAAKSWASLFSLEYVRGNKRVRTWQQIERHMKALTEGILTIKYHLPAGQDYVSLFLFEEPKLMEKIRSDAATKARFQPFREHFLFATFADVKRSAIGCWRKTGDTGFLYDFITGKPSFRVPP